MKIPVVMTALVAGLTLAAGPSAATGGSGGRTVTVTGPAGPAPQARPAANARPATVTLLTGDKVRLDALPDGGASVTPLTGRAADFVEFGWAGDRYAIPDSAVPYLSSTLDMRLFDVSYLVRAGLDDARSTTLPVTVAGGSGAGLPALHVTGQANGTASVTKTDATGLGKRLAQQWRDSRTGASTLAVGRLPGITRISLTAPPGAPALPAAPRQATAQAPKATGLPYHTLTINLIGRDGNPGAAVGFIHNVDDARLGSWVMNYPGQQGPLSFSVPEGTYSAEVSVLTGPANDLTSQAALVVKPQFTVDSDETVTLDARTAVPYRPALQTPPPDGYYQQDMLTFNRQAAAAGGVSVRAFGFDGVLTMLALRLISYPANGNPPLYATPAGPVTKGSLDFSPMTELAASANDSDGKPRYDLVFPSKGGVPASLTYPVPDSALTPVHSTIYQTDCTDCTTPTQLFPMVFLPWSENELGIAPIVPPGEHTDYWYSSAPDLTTWQAEFNSDDRTRRQGVRRTITPGKPIDLTWNNTTYGPAPTAPYAQIPAAIGINGNTGQITSSSVSALKLRICAACRQDDNGVLDLQMLPDTEPGHYAEASTYADQSSLRFWRDGTLVVSSDGLPLGTLTPRLPLPMLHTAAAYRLQWSWNGAVNTHAASDTTWTFRSAPGQKSALPDTEQCTPDPSRACAFLPLLFVTYDLPVDIHSQAKAGAPFKLAFTVAAQQNAPAPGGPAATVSVSYDDGATWSQPEDATSLGGGRFGLTIDHPGLAATSGFVSLRVRAHDAAGDAVDQTTIRAYGLTG